MDSNSMELIIDSNSENESFARNVIALFSLKLNPSLSELSDIKTAVSEAVTNCIVHGFINKIGKIKIKAKIDGEILHIIISDNGIGIENLDKALEPFYTTKKDEERSGMGFTIMKSFMDEVKVKSKLGKGTDVIMSKRIVSD